MDNSPEGIDFKKMKNKKTLFFIVVCSLFLRLGIAYIMKDSFFERGNRYSLINPIAHNLIHFREFSLEPGSPTADTEPFYPLFVALSYFLFGTHWLSIALTQSFINVLNAFIVYFMALKIFNNQKVAVIVFLLFLFYPFYMISCASVSDTVLFCFLLALTAFLTITFSRKSNFWIHLAIGVSWGLALLTRTSVISLIPFALIYLFLRLPFKKAVTAGLATLIGCLLLVTPWVYRNYHLTGKIFLATTRNSFALWYGYNKDTYDVIRQDISVDVLGKNIDEKIPELVEIRKKEFPASINREVEISKVLSKHALDFARRNLWLSLKMMPVKFTKFWTWNYNPVPSSEDPLQDILRRVIYTASYFPLLAFALLGVFLAKAVWRSHVLFVFFFFGYTAMHTILYGFTRLRVPLDQFLMVYAAVAVVFVFQKVKRILA